MANHWWAHVTEDEAAAIAEEHGIYNAQVVDQQGTDRTLEGQDDIGNTWVGKWYDGESLYDIRWHEK